MDKRNIKNQKPMKSDAPGFIHPVKGVMHPVKTPKQKVDNVSEEGGAGDQGTDKVVNKYKKDTPGQHILKQIRSITRKEDNDGHLSDTELSDPEDTRKEV